MSKTTFFWELLHLIGEVDQPGIDLLVLGPGRPAEVRHAGRPERRPTLSAAPMAEEVPV